jgi:hypothetical protein
LPRSEYRKSLIPDCQACVPDAGAVCDSPLHSQTLPWRGTQHPHYQFLWPPADGLPSASPVVHTVCEMLVHWGSHLLLYTHDLQTININTGWPTVEHNRSIVKAFSIGSNYLKSAFHISDKHMEPNECCTDPTAYTCHNTEDNNMKANELCYKSRML